MEDGTSGLPTKEEDEFRPFVRRLPEFKFWYSTTKAIAIGFFCSWWEIFNLPVFWPVLVVYWLILLVLTSKLTFFLRKLLEREETKIDQEERSWGGDGFVIGCGLMFNSATTNSAHDQIPLCSLHCRKDAVPRRCEMNSFRSSALHALYGRICYVRHSGRIPPAPCQYLILSLCKA